MISLKTLILGTAIAGSLLTPALARAEDAPAMDQGPGHHERFDPKKAFEDSDTDKNGALSMEEFLARHKEKFAEIDADKSGSLTPEELKAYGEKMHGMRQERREERREKRQEKMNGEAPKTEETPTP